MVGERCLGDIRGMKRSGRSIGYCNAGKMKKKFDGEESLDFRFEEVRKGA